MVVKLNLFQRPHIFSGLILQCLHILRELVLQRPYFIHGLVLVIIGFGGLIWNLGSWYQEDIKKQGLDLQQIEIDKRKAWEKYYGADLRIPLDRIKVLPDTSHVIVAGVDVTLHTAIQSIQSANFDSIELNESQGIVYVNVFIPNELREEDHDRFMFYQALIYTTIIRKLNPSKIYKQIEVSAYPKNGMGVLRGVYDFNSAANLMRFGFERSYELALEGNKKATTQ